MSKYTPGKWVARNDPNGSPADACIGLEDDTSPIDYVAVCHTRDAPIIAAAPELLEALMEADRLYSTYALTATGGMEVGKWINNARAAIAKARGDA